VRTQMRLCIVLLAGLLWGLVSTSAYASPMCIFTPNGTPICTPPFNLTCPVCPPPGFPKLTFEVDSIPAFGEIIGGLGTLNDIKSDILSVQENIQEAFGPKEKEAALAALQSIEQKINRAIDTLVAVDTQQPQPANPYLEADPTNIEAILTEVKNEDLFASPDADLAEQAAVAARRAAVNNMTQAKVYAFAENSRLAIEGSMEKLVSGLGEYAEASREHGELGAYLTRLQYLKAIQAIEMRNQQINGLDTMAKSVNQLHQAPLVLPESLRDAEYYEAPKTAFDEFGEETQGVKDFKNQMEETFDPHREFREQGVKSFPKEVERQHRAQRRAKYIHNQIDYAKSELMCHDKYVAKVDAKVREILPLLEYGTLQDNVFGTIFNGPFETPEAIFVTATDERYEGRNNIFGNWLRKMDGSGYLDGSFYRRAGGNGKTGAVPAACQAIEALNTLNTYNPGGALGNLTQAMKSQGNMKCQPTSTTVRVTNPLYNASSSTLQNNIQASQTITSTVGCLSYTNADQLAESKYTTVPLPGKGRFNAYSQEFLRLFNNNNKMRVPRLDVSADQCRRNYDVRDIQSKTGYGLLSEWMDLDKIEKYLFELRTGYDFSAGQDTGDGFEDQIIKYHEQLDDMAADPFVDYSTGELVELDLKTPEDVQKLEELMQENAAYLEELAENFVDSNPLDDIREGEARFQDYINAEVEDIEETLAHYQLFAAAVQDPAYQVCSLSFEPPSPYIDGERVEVPVETQYTFDPAGAAEYLSLSAEAKAEVEDDLSALDRAIMKEKYRCYPIKQDVFPCETF